ncbi:TPA: fimbrial protein [Salmonella enterica]|uniref:Fimbrial protein n=1 Tax=Salmonella enterica TaxID=28901 RepID=A0A747V5C8_SALER|nr:fimbrial protein [Salmonella enterica]
MMLRFKILSCLCLFLFVSSSCASAAETWQCPDIYVTRFDVNSLNSSATKPGAVGTSNGSIVYNWKNNITYTGTWWEWIGFRFDDLAADTSISDTSGGWFRVNDYLSIRGKYVAASRTYTIPEVAFWMTGSGPNLGSGGGQYYPLTLEFYLKKLPVDGVVSIPPIQLSYGIYFTANSTKPPIDEVLSCPTRVGATVAAGGTISVPSVCTITPKDLSVDFGVMDISSVRQGKINKKSRKLSVSCSSPENLYAAIRSSRGDELTNKEVLFPTSLSGVNIRVSAPDATQTADNNIVLLGNNETEGGVTLEFVPELDSSVQSPGVGEFQASGVIVIMRD